MIVFSKIFIFFPCINYRDLILYDSMLIDAIISFQTINSFWDVFSDKRLAITESSILTLIKEYQDQGIIKSSVIGQPTSLDVLYRSIMSLTIDSYGEILFSPIHHTLPI